MSSPDIATGYMMLGAGGSILGLTAEILPRDLFPNYQDLDPRLDAAHPARAMRNRVLRVLLGSNLPVGSTVEGKKEFNFCQGLRTALLTLPIGLSALLLAIPPSEGIKAGSFSLLAYFGTVLAAHLSSWVIQNRNWSINNPQQP